ncbi:MAG TPA: GntR family transcriptional regulator [Ktedonobacteraceae bacterium]|jgi:DNA-binding GntR family transcriptional regulator|nr:GntR family transcriptional regulator [Ktedonobacteraceae bacterium]
MKPIVQERLVDEAYQQLRELIFQNSYTAGQKLDIEHIAKQLGISRQPVVEATSRLAQEGLLVVRPRVGTFVRQLSSQDVHNILEARLMMELFAVTHARPQIEEIQELYSYIERMDAMVYDEGPFDYLSFNELDVQLHHALIRLAHNPLIERLYRGLHAQYVPVRAFYRNAHAHTLTNYGEHRTIVDALAKGDTAEATHALEIHIRNAEHGIQRIFQELQTTLL